MRKILFVLVDRANYGRLKPVMEEAYARPGLSCYTACGGSLVLPRFRSLDMLHKDGFGIDAKVFCSLEGNTTATMAKSVGLAVQGFTDAMERIHPDFVVIIGDRFEALGAAIAAAYTNRTIIHFQGGEVSGSIDESARHAITKLSHYHVPATVNAERNLVRMGERPHTILAVGCPVSDFALKMPIPEKREGILAIYHPTTTCPEKGAGEMRELLKALEQCDEDVTLLWPNIDAGSDAISKEIRRFRMTPTPWLEVLTNMEPEAFYKKLASVKCCVGNSSSFVRDSGFFGTPVVLVGERQFRRECAVNVNFASPTYESIALYISVAKKQSWERETRAWPRSTLYGSGGVSKAVVDAMLTIEKYSQKRLVA